ncbi:hypothetical protein [Bacillus sp. FJAT-47783]|uniref:hypothetical protein n=1 Tax=Bacillus sp. FJAT-47783 TaxID=2922712 RepID=UPI001FAB9372|nr:hypothetical protein [Bacillus sp. FJAT-47783]
MVRNSLLVIFFFVILSGCNPFQATPTALIHEPSLGVEEDHLLQVISETVPSDMKMITPKESKYPKTIHMFDLDGDEKEEAIVFFGKQDGFSPVSIAVFKKADLHEWSLTSQAELKGYDIEFFDVVDLTKKGKRQIVIGMTSFESSGKGLYIYEESDGELQSVYETDYSHMIIDDFNTDGFVDVNIVKHIRNEEARLEMLQMDENNRIQTIHQIELDPFVNGYGNVILGQVKQGKKAIFLDASVGAHSAYTQIVTFEHDNYRKWVDEEKDDVTFKPYMVYSHDVNQDNIVEIGLLEEPKNELGQLYTSLAETPFYEKYVQMNADLTYHTKYERYANYEKGFFITIDEKWNRPLRIVENENSVKIGSLSKWYVEIYWQNKDKNLQNQSYQIVKETDEFIFYVKKQHVSKDVLKRFHLLFENV